MKRNLPSLVGLIPAAGKGTRLGAMPLSKEILPIAVNQKNGVPKVQVVADCLLQHFAAAGIDQVYWVIGRGKWDIPNYFSHAAKIASAYVVIENSPNTPTTLSAAVPFIADRCVALGFPDILFDAPDAFNQIYRELGKRKADVVLGLFPAALPQSQDVVEVDDKGIVQRIFVKPKRTKLTHTWGIAVWTPTFSAFLSEWVVRHARSRKSPSKEMYVSDAVLAAMKQGLRVCAVNVSEQPFFDIGLPENLQRTWRGD